MAGEQVMVVRGNEGLWQRVYLPGLTESSLVNKQVGAVAAYLADRVGQS